MKRSKQGDSSDSTSSTSHDNSAKGLYEFSIFSAAVVTGTACSILSKILYDTTDSYYGKHFDKPLIQTLGMFVAMIFGLPLHWIIIWGKIPFPGYDRFVVVEESPSPQSPAAQDIVLDLDRTPRMRGVAASKEERKPLVAASDDNDYDNDYNNNYRIPIKTYFYLIIPAIFDCVATALCMVGLLYLDVSIYQLLRGSGIIFVALLRQSALKQQLYRFQWVGVGWNVVSVILVGATALLDSSVPTTGRNEDSNLGQAMIGVGFMLAGTLVQAMMFVFEEKVMRQDEVKVPPLLLFGMEGLWGAILTIVFLYPIGYYVPGHDNGSFENPWTTWEMLVHTPFLQLVMTAYCLAVFGYNFFAVLVTFSLSSVWHSILDNFRPMTVWFSDLFIYYVLTGSGFGESWTKYSWMQLAGMLVLIYGTAIYNAPDVGSIRLSGEWYSLGMDFSEEYNEILAQRLFSMGSYPSLQRFFTASSRRSTSLRIGYGRRAETWREGDTSPKEHHDAILLEQHSI